MDHLSMASQNVEKEGDQPVAERKELGHKLIKTKIRKA